MRVGHYVSKSEQNRFWYEKRKDFDYIYYIIQDRRVKTKVRNNRSWYADRISYSVTKPDLSY